MSDLIQQIEALSREQALEASSFVGDELLTDEEASDRAKNVLQPLLSNPYQNIEEIEQLARITLISAALVPEYEDVVRKAVEGAGKRNFIMGGAEIVALAGIALTALNLIITKGMASRKITITEKDEKGNVTKITEEVVTYQVSPKLGPILQNYFGHLVTPKNGAK